jgi:prepilin-type processing-associated H-X9-DG protein
MGLAAESHLDTIGYLPTGGIGGTGGSFGAPGDPDRGFGKPQPGGWTYNILPFIEDGALHDAGAGRPITEKVAAEVLRLQSPRPWLNCPTRRPTRLYPNANDRTYGGAHCTALVKCDYAACSGDIGDPEEWASQNCNGVCFPTSQVTAARVPDGLSHTYFAGEKAMDADHYLDGGGSGGDDDNAYIGSNVDSLRTVNNSTQGFYSWQAVPLSFDTHGYEAWGMFGSAHSALFNMVFCDGSVHGIPYDIDREIHRRLGVRDDGLGVDANKFY